AGERFAQTAAERRLHPGKTFARRFPFDEYAPQIPLIRQTLDRRFINRLLFRLEESENLRSKRRRHALENFVRSHPSAHTMTASALSSTKPLQIWRDRECDRRVRFNFSSEPIGHVGQQQHPKSQRDAEERE